MAAIDPLQIMRDNVAREAYREAYRQHQRALRAVSLPWLIIAAVAAFLEIGLFLYALFHNIRTLSLPAILLELVFSGAVVIAWIRSWLYRRSHPFEQPEPPSAFRWDRKFPYVRGKDGL